ncbi:MAG: TIGR02281 family clan AA aspartic protease [Sphingomonas sp.]|nr:TIGR02281 family clan AA aspartic protease [Sphingomonas sp.]
MVVRCGYGDGVRLTLFLVAVVGAALGLMVPLSPPLPPPLPPPGAAPPDRAGGAFSVAPIVVAPPLAPPSETVLDRTPAGHFVAVADVNTMPIRFVVDTGADIVALTEADARQANIAFDPLQYRVIGRGAAGDVRGQEVTLDSLVLDGKRATNVRAVVIEGGNVSLLGHTYLRQLQSVSIEGDRMRLR